MPRFFAMLVLAVLAGCSSSSRSTDAGWVHDPASGRREPADAWTRPYQAALVFGAVGEAGWGAGYADELAKRFEERRGVPVAGEQLGMFWRIRLCTTAGAQSLLRKESLERLAESLRPMIESGIREGRIVDAAELSDEIAIWEALQGFPRNDREAFPADPEQLGLAGLEVRSLAVYRNQLPDSVDRYANADGSLGYLLYADGTVEAR